MDHRKIFHVPLSCFFKKKLWGPKHKIFKLAMKEIKKNKKSCETVKMVVKIRKKIFFNVF